MKSVALLHSIHCKEDSVHKNNQNKLLQKRRQKSTVLKLERIEKFVGDVHISYKHVLFAFIFKPHIAFQSLYIHYILRIYRI